MSKVISVANQKGGMWEDKCFSKSCRSPDITRTEGSDY